MYLPKEEFDLAASHALVDAHPGAFFTGKPRKMVKAMVIHGLMWPPPDVAPHIPRARTMPIA